MSTNPIRNLITAGLLGLLLSGCAPETPDATRDAEIEVAEEAVEPTPEPTPEPTAAPTPKPAATPRPAPAAAAPAPQPQPAICANCGTVVAIEEFRQKGEGSGAGAVAGAVAGGVAGHQFGGGRGKDAATAAGAILGAIAGHQIEKQVRATTTYNVNVSMENGSSRIINVPDPAGLYVGAKVRVENNTIYPR